MTNPKVLFAGTPEFALASLEALVGAGVVPVAVLTQPDRPAGRGKKLKQSPVKQFAVAKGIDVIQPKTLRDEDVVATLNALAPDLMVVAAYGLILPQEVLDIPAHGCLNVHASLLPRWRGAAPIQAAVFNGDPETGISLMRMTAGLDCGPVYSTGVIDIGQDETAGALHDRLAELGGEMLVRDLPQILDGSLEAFEQDEGLAIYAPKINKQDGLIDWSRSAAAIKRQVRAYNPVPGAWFDLDGERIKVWEVTRTGSVHDQPGKVVSSGRSGLVVACGEDGLLLLTVQRPGKRPVTGEELSTAVSFAGKVLGAEN